jgi:hypothetical protein
MNPPHLISKGWSTAGGGWQCGLGSWVWRRLGGWQHPGFEALYGSCSGVLPCLHMQHLLSDARYVTSR